MVWLYFAALIFGGAFTVPMFLGGFDTDTDADLDLGDADIGGDIEFDMDAEFDTGADFGTGADADSGLDSAGAGLDVGDASGLFDGVGEFALSLLSFRSLVFASTFFGIAGLVLSAFDYFEPVPLVTALVLGFVAASVNSTLMTYLRKSEANSSSHERELVGRPAQIVLPLGPGERGRIKIDVDGQPRFFVARALRDNSDQVFAMGEPVLVCEFEEGTALVAPMPTTDF